MHTVDRSQTIVTHDSGHPRDQMIPFYEATTPRGYLGWANSSQLGYGLGIAMGAKLGAPEKLVVNIMGDAAIGMAGMDIEHLLSNHSARPVDRSRRRSFHIRDQSWNS